MPPLKKSSIYGNSPFMTLEDGSRHIGVDEIGRFCSECVSIPMVVAALLVLRHRIMTMPASSLEWCLFLLERREPDTPVQFSHGPSAMADLDGSL